MRVHFSRGGRFAFGVGVARGQDVGCSNGQRGLVDDRVGIGGVNGHTAFAFTAFSGQCVGFCGWIHFCRCFRLRDLCACLVGRGGRLTATCKRASHQDGAQTKTGPLLQFGVKGHDILPLCVDLL